jgi:malate dehydrogenase (oxaloacetate-decarboxylating)
MAGLHIGKQKLEDVKLVVFGAGTAGVGIADQVRDAIAAERGISKEEAAKQIWFVALFFPLPIPRISLSYLLFITNNPIG